MPSAAPTARTPAAAALGLGGVCVALALAWLCIDVNLKRGCVARDTPYLEICPEIASPGSDTHRAELRARIAANPGDANAYVQLAVASDADRRGPWLDAAQRLAPTAQDVLLMRAAAALQRQDWLASVAPLIQLAEYRADPQAIGALARLIGGGQGPLLAGYLAPGNRWFAPVLARMPQSGAPFSTALPLVAQALKSDALDPGTVRAFVRQLKASGAWVDAYSLWLALHPGPLPTLFNGSFDGAFQPDGFDWEPAVAMPASRAGAIVERHAAQRRSGVLEIRFTGRALAVPLVRQHLFLGEGRYRLRGDYMARQLRMEEGLAWAVRCSAKPGQAGLSAALDDTAGAWQPFEFEFSIPPGCGAVASLQLETRAPYEAAVGARGNVAFDAFSLEKLSP